MCALASTHSRLLCTRSGSLSLHFDGYPLTAEQEAQTVLASFTNHLATCVGANLVLYIVQLELLLLLGILGTAAMVEAALQAASPVTLIP